MKYWNGKKKRADVHFRSWWELNLGPAERLIPTPYNIFKFCTNLFPLHLAFKKVFMCLIRKAHLRFCYKF